MSIERVMVDLTKPGTTDEVHEGMRDCEKRCMPSRAKAIAEASGKAGWAPGRAARFSWWLEALTREQALAMVSAYYDEVDAGR